MAVDLDDRVVDIQQGVLAGGRCCADALVHTRAGHEPGACGQCEQEPGCDRVELAHVPEGERAQERPERRGRVRRAEDLAQPPWRSTAMSSMLSAPTSIPPTIEATFRPAFAPLSVATVRRSSVSVRRPAASANAIIGISPAADTRFGSSKTAEVRVRV